MKSQTAGGGTTPLSENILAPFMVVISAALVLMGVMVAVVFAQRVDERLDRFQQLGFPSPANPVSAADRVELANLESDVDTLQLAALISGGVGLAVVYLGLLYIVWSGWKSTTMRRIILEAANAQLEDRVEARVVELREANQRLQGEIGQRQKAEDELQQSRQRIASAEEGLRKHIAETLHGKVQTSLLVAWHKMGESLTLMEQDPVQAKEMLTEVRSDLDRIREKEVREVSHTLHPSVIRVGLLPAVRTLLETYETDLAVALNASEEVTRLDDVLENRIPDTIRLIAYRVLQEGLSNIQRHAKATKAVVTLAASDDRLTVLLKDDGVGFDTESVGYGLGLNSIADRVAVAGGEWKIESTPGSGTTLRAELPIRASESAPEAGSGDFA